MREVLEKALAKIKPSKEEEEKIKSLSERVLAVAGEIGKKYNFSPMLCGSVAKGTWLKPAELDLFLLFPESLEREKLEDLGLKAGKEICKRLKARYEKKYTEHPYLRAMLPEKIEMDVVPCYDTLPTKIKSAVDRTPWHVRYVLEHLKKEQRDEVRLLKKFCKAQKVYGADLMHQGLSGYLCELLIIKFGSFENVVKQASKWYPQVVLWLERAPEKNVLEEFKGHPLVFIDPVDPKRNVAAAVSYESFFRFVKACREFLLAPSERFFFAKPKKLSVKGLGSILRKRDSKFYVLWFPKPDVHDDVLASQLRRFQKLLKYHLEKAGFLLHRTEIFVLERSFGLLMEAEVWKLPKIMKRSGPEILSKHAKDFLKHYAGRKAWIENNAWVVEDERKFQTIEEFLQRFFKGSAKALEQKGIPSYIAKQSKKLLLCKGDTELIKLASKHKDFRVWLSEYFAKNLNIFEKRI